MKNKILTSKYFLLSLLIFSGIFSSCKKEMETANAPRLFRPIVVVTTASGQNWIKATYTDIKAATSFTVALSTDSFKTIYRSVVTDSAAYTFTNVDWDQQYQIRVRSNGKDSTSSSGYYAVSGINIIFPTLLNNVADSAITDVGVKPSWINNNGNFSTFKIFKMPGDSLAATITLTAQDTVKKNKEIYGLKPSTNYMIVVYSGNDYKGRKSFRTVPAQVFAIPVDLRGIKDDSARTLITTTYLQGLANGSTIILKRGLTYTIGGTVALQNSAAFTTGLGFGNNLAVLDLTTGNFNVTAGATIGQVSFSNVNLLGNQTAYGARYVFNINTACTIGEIIATGCKIRDLRGVVRVQAGPTTIDTVRFNNCMIDSIKDYGIVNSDNASALIKNINVVNSTISNAQKLFINSKSSGTASINLQNCTFCYTPIGGSYVMDYNTRTISNGVTMTNCIFGPGINNTATPAVKDSTNGFRGTANFTTNGNYQTSDLHFMQKSGSITYPLQGLTVYSGSSTTLFKKPDQADFTIIDANFPGKITAGDPRWWKQ